MSVIEAAHQRILLAGGTGDDLAWVRSIVAEVADLHWSIERAEDPAAAMARIGRGDFDLIVFVLDSITDEFGLAALRRIREFAPLIPIVCLTAIGNDAETIRFIHAGAQDCIDRRDLDAHRFARSVRLALARSGFQQGQDDRREHAAREREIGGLNAISGPAPLPISGRSFGMMPLIDRAPHDFSGLVAQYSALLDLALEERTVRVESRLGEELNGLADRLGLLGAAPRDIIDLHKAAITGRLEGQSIRRARAYVEEGRLMLLQTMGFLASFYRHLSWGTVSDPRGHTRDQLTTVPPTTGRGST